MINTLIYKLFHLSLLKKSRKTMRKQKMADVLCKAEAFATNPNNLNSKGQLKPRAKHRLDKMITKIAFLSQFEKPNKEYHY